MQTNLILYFSGGKSYRSCREDFKGDTWRKTFSNIHPYFSGDTSWCNCTLRLGVDIVVFCYYYPVMSPETHWSLCLLRGGYTLSINTRKKWKLFGSRGNESSEEGGEFTWIWESSRCTDLLVKIVNELESPEDFYRCGWWRPWEGRIYYVCLTELINFTEPRRYGCFSYVSWLHISRGTNIVWNVFACAVFWSCFVARCAMAGGHIFSEFSGPVAV